jgi:uncharacterized protein
VNARQGTRRLELADYRRRVASLYAELREHGSDAEGAFDRFRGAREELFATHPATPLEPQASKAFAGLAYYPYDPALRFVAPVHPFEADDGVHTGTIRIELGDDGVLALERVGQVHLTVAGVPVALTVFWVGGYGGGLFLPFGDATNGSTTYGGGRYLLDTIKGADLGAVHGDLLLDFNYAYNPSCAYSPQWVCPLAPQENRLPLPVAAGEHAPYDAAASSS